MSLQFEYRSPEGSIVRSTSPGDVWPDWKGDREHWLFVAPHDDDIVLGAGLTFISAVESGIPVYAVVATTGEAGYCRPEHKGNVQHIRRRECRTSFEMMGMPAENLIVFEYPDADFTIHLGRRLTDDPNCPTAIAGASGLQNSFVWALRRILPTRVFLPTQTDIHPDHKMVHQEFVMSIFHAQGNIWPELGAPIPEIPKLYEYATYCDFLTPPTIRVKTSDDLFERKLNAILAYKSQEQIDLSIANQRKAGPQEFIRELEFNILNPRQYEGLFE